MLINFLEKSLLYTKYQGVGYCLFKIFCFCLPIDAYEIYIIVNELYYIRMSHINVRNVIRHM